MQLGHYIVTQSLPTCITNVMLCQTKLNARHVSDQMWHFKNTRCSHCAAKQQFCLPDVQETIQYPDKKRDGLHLDNFTGDSLLQVVIMNI